MARQQFTPSEAREIVECLEILIESDPCECEARFWEARQRLKALTGHRIMAITRSFIRSYPGVLAEEALDKSWLRIIVDLKKNGRCYLEGMREKDQACRSKKFHPAMTDEEFVLRAERYVSRAATTIKSDLKNLQKKERRKRVIDEDVETGLTVASAGEEFTDAFLAALKNLTPREKEVVEGILVESKLREELARKLGVSRPRISQHYQAGVGKLAEALKDFRDEDYSSRIKVMPSRNSPRSQLGKKSPASSSRSSNQTAPEDRT